MLASHVDVDVVVVGGGPSGCTLAALLRKYRPETSVLVLERERYPRHRIGESLLVDVNRILLDMGALEDVERAGFSRKYGATFLWGAGREPFHFLWKEGSSIINSPQGYQLEYTWHVDRGEYDKILADCARRRGAEVHEGAEVTGLLWSESESEPRRVSGVTARGPDGQESRVTARFVIDCAGDKGPAHRQLANRQLDEDLRNVAIYGYLRGVKSVEPLTGTDEKRTLILTHPQGWVWVIPLRNGVTSVGYVTAAEHYRDDLAKGAPKDKREYFESILRGLKEHEQLFEGSELVDYRGDGKLVHAVQEYSYQCDNIWGPGWATCGNAAGFVDAILSIGVFMAQTHAQFLACALRSVLDGDADEEHALSCYATTVRDNLSAFRAVAHMFYAFNCSMSEWWRECSEQLRKSTLVPQTADKQAFLAFFTGFSARSAIYEEAVNAFGGSFLLDISEQLFGDEELFTSGDLHEESRRARSLIKRDPVLRFVGDVKTREFLLPDIGRGALAPVTRIDITPPREHGEDAEDGGDVGRRVYLPAQFARVPALLDGRRRISDIARKLVADGAPGPLRACMQDVMKLTYRLACMGAVTEATSPTGRRPATVGR